MSEPVWMDPPQASSQGRRVRPRTWEPLLRPLMEQPKRWALVRECETPGKARSVRGALKRNPEIVLPEGRWEFKSRTLDNGKGGVFARYLGPEDGVSER